MIAVPGPASPRRNRRTTSLPPRTVAASASPMTAMNPTCVISSWRGDSGGPHDTNVAPAGFGRGGVKSSPSHEMKPSALTAVKIAIKARHCHAVSVGNLARTRPVARLLLPAIEAKDW